MPTINWKRGLVLLPVIGLAAVAPNAFPAAQLGYASLHDLALYAILPSLAALAGLATLSYFKGWRDIAAVIFSGAMAGAVATLALEGIRYPGFRLGYMPGNLPDLMGVLLLDRFAEGPSAASTLAGFAYHAWNGASFGIIFAAFSRIGFVRRTPAWTTVYGILIGIGFLVSPVVRSLGVGLFGADFGWPFAATVLTAHAAFGFALSSLLRMGESCLCPAFTDSLPVPKTRVAPTSLDDDVACS